MRTHHSRREFLSCAGAAALSAGWASAAPSASSARGANPEIAAIYFPGFHRDDHYDAWFGEGWNEWKLVLDAKPRFPGQRFFLPEWGPFDEADPKWMEKQIALAAGHGVDVFLFDWYWYSGVKILHRPLEEGFLQAGKRQQLKYALMWANHDWNNVFPAPLPNKQTLWLPSRITPADFDRVMTHCIALHFRQPNYWRVDGGLYFSVFRADAFVRQLGGVEKARAVVDRARQQIAAAGLGQLHLAAFARPGADARNLRAAGFDSLTSYTLGDGGKARLPQQPTVNYADLIGRHEAFWKQMDAGVLPYAPIVSVGWDTTTRWAKDAPWPPPNAGYPYSSVVVGNTPELFGEVCRQARRHCQSSRLPPPAILVNAWNEWTEGSVLLPDRHYKTRFLEQLRDVFQADR